MLLQSPTTSILAPPLKDKKKFLKKDKKGKAVKIEKV